MNESHSSEVEKVLLFISDAQERARRASDRIERDGADDHIIGALREAQSELGALREAQSELGALREAQSELGDLRRRLMQGTYYAAPRDGQQLAL